MTALDNLGEIKRSKLEYTELSDNMGKEEEARFKANFISSFRSVAKPGLQERIAEKYGEDVYKDAEEGKEDFSQLLQMVNSDKFKTKFSEYLRIMEEKSSIRPSTEMESWTSSPISAEV